MSKRLRIGDIIQDIVDGRDIASSVTRLQPQRRKAIAYVAEALFLLGREDVDHLVALLRAELRRDRMQPAFSLAWTLAHLEDRAALDVLMTALRHRDAYVRWAGSIGLRRLRAEEALAALNAAAADRSSLVRGEAVEALAQQGDPSSLPVLTKRLRDRYPGIQAAAKHAIEAIGRRTREIVPR